MAERLPDRLRDRLYFGMARLRERMEVADAVHNGRAVTEPRLAARAVTRAQRVQRRLDPKVTLAVLALAGIGYFAYADRWFLLFFVPMLAIAFHRRGRLRERAQRAEQANQQLVDAQPR